MAEGTIQKKIQIITEFLTTGMPTAHRTRKTIGLMQEMADGNRISMSEMSDRLKRTGLEVRSFSTDGREQAFIWDRVNKGFMTTENATQKAGRAFARFRMELLGIMFFGMAGAKMFGQYVKSALALTGIMDVLSAVMSMLVLPILMPFVELGFKALGWLMKAPKWVQFLAGAFVVLGFVMFSSLMIIGQLALGVASLSIALTKLGIAGSAQAVIFTTLGMSMLVIVGIFSSLYIWLKIIPEKLAEIIGLFKELYSIIRRAPKEATQGIFGALMSFMPKTGFGKYQLASAIGIPGLAAGGIVTRPTLAVLGERGPEAVVPLGGGAFMPTVNVYATISGDVEINRLADEITNRIEEQLYRRMRSKIL